MFVQERLEVMPPGALDGLPASDLAGALGDLLPALPEIQSHH